MGTRYAFLKRLVLLGVLLGTLFGSNLRLASADITLKVKVTDCTTGLPISGAALSVSTGSHQNPGPVYTNLLGIASLAPVTPCNMVHKFTVRADGFVKYTWSEYLSPGSTYREICMTPYAYRSQETEEPVLETEEPAAVLCGLSQTANPRSRSIGYTQHVMVPCCSKEAVAYGYLGSFGDGKYHRFTNPVFQQVSSFDTSLGWISRKLVSFDAQEVISSCADCGLCDAQPTLYDAIFLKDLTWSGEVKALQPVDFILHLRGQGPTIQDQPFVVKLDFGQDFPYEHLVFDFDSQDGSSSTHLQPARLQEGDFTMRVSGIRLPMTYIGSIYAVISLKNIPDSSSSLVRELSVGSSPLASYHCSGAALNAISAIGSPAVPGSEVTLMQLDYQHKLELCGDNAGCQAKLMDNFQETWIEKVLGMVVKGPEKVALIMKSLIEFGFDFVKCGTWLVDFFQELLHSSNQSGEPVTGFLTASPVYPLIKEKTSGRQTGFLTDGRLVQEITDSYAVQLGEQRMILLPGEGKDIELSVSGYENGKMDLYMIQAQEGGGDKMVTYRDVSVQKGAHMRLDPGNPALPLEIDANGSTTYQAPTSILLTNQAGESRELPVVQVTPTMPPLIQNKVLSELSSTQRQLGVMLCLSVVAIILLLGGFLMFAYGYTKYPQSN